MLPSCGEHGVRHRLEHSVTLVRSEAWYLYCRAEIEITSDLEYYDTKVGLGKKD